MAVYSSETPKKFLDYEGLVKVFQLIKGEIGEGDAALQARVAEIEKNIGEWKETTNNDFKTIAEVILELQRLVGESSVSDQIKAAIEALDVNKIGDDTTYIKWVEEVDGKINAVADELNTSVVKNDSDVTGDTLTDVLENLDDRVEDLETKVGTSSVADQIAAELDKLDYDGVTGGTVITQVTQENGKVSATTANLTSTDKTVKINGLDLGVNIDGTTIVKNADGILSVDPTATAVAGEDAIVVTGGTDGKKVSLKIAEGEKVLSQDGNGLKTTITIAKETTGLEANVKEQYKLVGIGGEQLGETIKVYKDSSLQSVELVDTDDKNKKGQFLKFTYILSSGDPDIVYLDVSTFLVESEFKDGLQVSSSGEVSVRKDADSEDFLTVSANGVKISGVQTAIDTECKAVYNSMVRLPEDEIIAAFNAVNTSTPQEPEP